MTRKYPAVPASPARASAVLLAAVLVCLAGCNAAPSDGAASGAASGSAPVGADAKAAPASQALAVQELATGLAFPWGAAVLPDGGILVTEREGRLRLIRDGQLVAAPVGGVPPVLDDNQGGLFDVALHPDFATNQLVYLSFAKGTGADNRTAVVRGRFTGAALEDVTPVWEAAAPKSGGAHFGGRLLFLPDSTLLVSLGDGYAYRDRAQDLSSHLGKVVHITDTGQPVAGGPFAGRAGALPDIHSLGHRNVQGLVRDPASGAVYAHEHGPKGGDEVNLLKAGANYGWPVITYGVDYSGAPISLRSSAPGMEQPLVYWVPSIAPAGMAFYSGALFPAWQGDLIVAALAGEQLRRVDLEGGQVAGQQIILDGRGERYRQVIQMPDGALLALTDSTDGKVLRITPGS
jgi:aldose sugar dehydrogenase